MPACFVRTCCAVAVQEHDQRATTLQCNIKRTVSSHFSLHSSHSALQASPLHFTLHSSSHLESSDFFSPLSPHLSSSHLLSFHTCHLSKTVFISFEHWESSSISTHLTSSARQKALTDRKKCTKKHCTQRAFAHKLWDTDPFTQKKWQNTLYYNTLYFVLQCLHRALPSTTLYYNACAKYVPVLL